MRSIIPKIKGPYVCRYIRWKTSFDWFPEMFREAFFEFTVRKTKQRRLVFYIPNPPKLFDPENFMVLADDLPDYRKVEVTLKTISYTAKLDLSFSWEDEAFRSATRIREFLEQHYKSTHILYKEDSAKVYVRVIAEYQPIEVIDTLNQRTLFSFHRDVYQLITTQIDAEFAPPETVRQKKRGPSPEEITRVVNAIKADMSKLSQGERKIDLLSAS